MLKVKSVFANNDYTLFVELSDGRSGIFDVKPYLEKVNSRAEKFAIAIKDYYYERNN